MPDICSRTSVDRLIATMCNDVYGRIINIYIYIYMYIHMYTYIYIYIYTYESR